MWEAATNDLYSTTILLQVQVIAFTDNLKKRKGAHFIDITTEKNYKLAVGALKEMLKYM